MATRRPDGFGIKDAEEGFGLVGGTVFVDGYVDFGRGDSKKMSNEL